MTSDAPDLPPVSFDIAAPHVALIRIDRPAARNAINGAAARAIAAAVARIESDPELRVAVIASMHPGMFSAGADLKEVAAGQAAGLRIGDAGFAGLVDAVRTKPWIAAVDGAALGGGCELCLACDMILASPDARFGLPEVKLGMIAGAGGVHRLARVLPRNIALELVASGGTIDAARAERYGMVNRVVPSDDLLAAAIELASAIAANAPLSVAESLTLARRAGECSDAELRGHSREAMNRVMASRDAREGPRAFVERRPPRWTGD